MKEDSEKKATVRRIIRSYDAPLARLYSAIRFFILHYRFLDEIGQYLPSSGLVLDVGCGYGLSAQYLAAMYPNLRIRAMDVNAMRIERAAEAARRMKLDNVEFRVGDAREFVCDEEIQGAFMFDLIHHIPQESVAPLIASLAAQMKPGCKLVIKDVEPRPLHKLIYVWLTDKMVDYRAPVHYWASADVRQLLDTLGFDVYRHSVLEHLPSPHVVYIATKR